MTGFKLTKEMVNTEEKVNRIKQAIAETRTLLSNENQYRLDLQKPEKIEFYTNHLEYLHSLIN